MRRRRCPPAPSPSSPTPVLGQPCSRPHLSKKSLGFSAKASCRTVASRRSCRLAAALSIESPAATGGCMVAICLPSTRRSRRPLQRRAARAAAIVCTCPVSFAARASTLAGSAFWRSSRPTTGGNTRVTVIRGSTATRSEPRKRRRHSMTLTSALHTPNAQFPAR